jgi:hypothetical protein
VGCGESLLMQSIHLWKSMSEERDRRLADKRVRINLRKQQQANVLDVKYNLKKLYCVGHHVHSTGIPYARIAFP